MLANPGHDYLIYTSSGEAIIDLIHIPGEFSVHWINSATREDRPDDPISGDQTIHLHSPNHKPAIVWLTRQ
jgi:hypothetical protein